MQTWKLEVSTKWDVLGPFPISAREQHFLSPSFPIDLPYQHEPNRTWHSSLADGGKVGWKSFNSSKDGHLLISHPHIRWTSLRATEGWATFQHHNVLRTTLKVTPPSKTTRFSAPWLALAFQRASFFTLIPVNSTDPAYTSFIPEWYPGNIYALPRPPKQLLEPPALSSTEPTCYHLFVSGDYEIRLFGDPDTAGQESPVLDISFDIDLEPRQNTVVLDPDLDVVCDFVQGWAFGTALGVGIRTSGGDWGVSNVEPIVDAASTFSLSLLQKQHLTPSQSRIIPIAIEQHTPYRGDTLQLGITLINSQDQSQAILTPILHIRHWSSWDDAARYKAVKATYFLARTPTSYMGIPPKLPHLVSSKPPIIALHGAGVEISDPFWPAALPRQLHSWIICPAGRTSWGLDWHGLSADDVWGSLAALTHILSTKEEWTQWTIRNGTRVVLMGHSNGGQGTWFLNARYPDRVLAAIPAAAYIKSQQYVPSFLSRGAHFIDPSHGGILAASLTPDDNDLFLSNVVDSNILAIHGGEDENVPTWHSREMVGLVKSLRSDANISFIEDQGQPHWYSDVLSSSHVQKFLSSVLETGDIPSDPTSVQFTLTVATPTESGSLHGFSIREVKIPGRLARLHVSSTINLVFIKTNNVHTFSINACIFRKRNFNIDGTHFQLRLTPCSDSWFQREGDTWRALSHPPSIRPMGPVSQIIRSPASLLVIIPSNDRHAHSIARRLAHAMLLYFRLDTDIITDAEALARTETDQPNTSNLIIIGSNNEYGRHVLQSGPGVVRVSSDMFTVHDTLYTGASLALIFLHSHPSSADRVVLFLCGNDDSGLERAARLLLPIRTGVPLPEFLIIGKESDDWGVGGLHGGGFWSRTWTWSEAMAWST